MERKRVRALVFGSAGVGKTSMLNELTNQSLPTSDGAIGCTFETTSFPPSVYDGVTYEFIDTAGLNEPKSGKVSAGVAIRNLLQLLKTSKEGFNLLVYVISAGRITQMHVDNYKLFVDVITESKIPVICVVTGCENYEPTQKWADDNNGEFKKAGMHFRQIVGVCFGRNGRLEPIFAQLRGPSKEAVYAAARDCAAETPVDFLGTDADGRWQVVRRTWDFFCSWASTYITTANSWRWVNEKVVDLLQRLELPREIIEEVMLEF